MVNYVSSIVILATVLVQVSSCTMDISRVYWICTTEGSSMYSPKAQPERIHTTARSTIETGLLVLQYTCMQISTVQVACTMNTY